MKIYRKIMTIMTSLLFAALAITGILLPITSYAMEGNTEETCLTEYDTTEETCLTEYDTTEEPGTADTSSLAVDLAEKIHMTAEFEDNWLLHFKDVPYELGEEGYFIGVGAVIYYGGDKNSGELLALHYEIQSYETVLECAQKGITDYSCTEHKFKDFSQDVNESGWYYFYPSVEVYRKGDTDAKEKVAFYMGDPISRYYTRPALELSLDGIKTTQRIYDGYGAYFVYDHENLSSQYVDEVRMILTGEGIKWESKYEESAVYYNEELGKWGGQLDYAMFQYDYLNGDFSMQVRAFSNNIDVCANGRVSSNKVDYNTDKLKAEIKGEIKPIIDENDSALAVIKKLITYNKYCMVNEIVEEDATFRDKLFSLYEQIDKDYGYTYTENTGDDYAKALFDVSKVKTCSLGGIQIWSNSSYIEPSCVRTLNIKKYDEDIRFADESDAAKYKDIKAVMFGVDAKGDYFEGYGGSNFHTSLPVFITMPVPNGYTTSDLAIISYTSEYNYEEIKYTDNKDGTISFYYCTYMKSTSNSYCFVFASVASQERLVRDFVTRLYNVCLDREPEKDGLNYWTEKLINGEATGAQVAYGFIFSKEFIGKNYCNSCYLDHLYNAFLGRNPDVVGKSYWIDEIESGRNREDIFNGFTQSQEFSEICENYGIIRGDGIDKVEYGTIPTGPCSGCGEIDGVTAFTTRLYEVCLDRTPDAEGLDYWCQKLWSREESGTKVAHGFIFSKEFTGKNYDNSDYVEYLYKAFFSRPSDSDGKAYWVDKLNNGATREDVFYGFTDSQEFTNLCNRYGIIR